MIKVHRTKQISLLFKIHPSLYYAGKNLNDKKQVLNKQGHELIRLRNRIT